jgi:glycerol kinase
LLGAPVQRPTVSETTALGAAYLAGLAVGYWNDLDDVTKNWRLQRQFNPDIPADRRRQLHQGWQRAIQRALQWEQAKG